MKISSRIFWLFALTMSLSIGSSAATRTFNVSAGSWNLAANWSPAVVPVANDDVIIPATARIDSVPAITLNSISFSGTDTLNAAASGNTVTVTTTFSVPSGTTVFSGSSSTGRMQWTINPGCTSTINGTFTLLASSTPKSFTVNGTIAFGSSGLLNGSGTGSTFVLGAVGTLKTANSNGIDASASTGSVQTIARNFDTLATYEYNGSGPQNTGSGLPTTFRGTLKISSSNTVTLSAARTIRSGGSVTLTAGTFAAGTSLTMSTGSIINAQGGTITGTIQGTGAYTVVYTGSSRSTGNELTGSGTKNLSINMTAGQVITLPATLTVGTLTLTQGVCSISGTLTATTVTGGGSTSFIDGLLAVSCVASVATKFPVGNLRYSPVTITSNLTRTFSVSVTTGPPVNTVNANDVLNCTYHITHPASTATLTFGYDDADIPAGATEAEWTSSEYSGSQWDPVVGGTENAAANSYTLTGHVFTPGSSDWTLGGAEALPIELMNLTASAVGLSGVTLNWSTQTESNNLGFYVERRREGSIAITLISNLIQGAGTSLEPHDYTFTDQNVQPGTYFYTLKQVDVDGHATHSSAIKVVVAGALGVADSKPLSYQLGQNYPNPFNPTTNIAFELPEQGIVTLKVFNMIGQEVALLINGVQYNAGDVSVRFNAESIASGVYYYHLNVQGIGKSFESIKRMMLVR